jgi:hypothetical protein
MKLHLCTSQVTCTRVNKILGVDTQYTAKKFRNVKGNKELTFIMILPLQMFWHYTVSDQNQMSPVYLFIQIQILIGFQPNRFVTKYSKKGLWFR